MGPERLVLVGRQFNQCGYGPRRIGGLCTLRGRRRQKPTTLAAGGL